MDKSVLTHTIIEGFDAMSSQLQAAARVLLDRPSDVALLSMRELARKAGVKPATMTRLAKHLGFAGYDDLRALYADAMRAGAAGFAGKASAQAESQKLKGDHALAADMLVSIARQITQLAEPAVLDRIVAVASALSKARRVYCLGLRASHATAWHVSYILSLISEKSLLLDGIGGTGTDAFARGTHGDVLLVASVAPYTKTVVEFANHAQSRGIEVVAVTDSPVSPLARIATHAFIVPTDSPSFFHAVSPGFAVAEVLGALVAGHGGAGAVDALDSLDRQLLSLDVHLSPNSPKRPL
jgi:DNA-binding MurR/RpiR family transcriptional regulator